jgi:hypothetical protein
MLVVCKHKRNEGGMLLAAAVYSDMVTCELTAQRVRQQQRVTEHFCSRRLLRLENEIRYYSFNLQAAFDVRRQEGQGSLRLNAQADARMHDKQKRGTSYTEPRNTSHETEKYVTRKKALGAHHTPLVERFGRNKCRIE